MKSGSCMTSVKEDHIMEMASKDQLDASVSLSTLLSSVLGTIDDEDLESNNFDDPNLSASNEEAQACSMDIGSGTAVIGSSWALNSFNSKDPWDIVLPNEDVVECPLTTADETVFLEPSHQITPKIEDSHQMEVSSGIDTLERSISQLPWQPAQHPRGEKLQAISNLPPFTEVLRSPLHDNLDTPYLQENVLPTPDGVMVPWVPQAEFQPTRLSPQGPLALCEPSPATSVAGERVGNYYLGPSGHHIKSASKHLLSIKIEPQEPLTGAYPAKVPTPLLSLPPLETLPPYISHNPAVGGPFPEQIVQNYAQGSRVWRLAVEEWQTQQTTFRYYPSHFEAPYFGGWSFEMPSSAENSPISDPTGSHGASELSPLSIGDGTPKGPSTGSKRVEGKRCGVCGDRALGYNFNAITCESCKAFFRRNALKNKEYRCPFNDQCEVTAVTRRFCQRCRLRKCFEVGMKKEWIMSEEEKKKKRKKIEENRARKMGDVESSSPSSLSPASPPCTTSAGIAGGGANVYVSNVAELCQNDGLHGGQDDPYQPHHYHHQQQLNFSSSSSSSSPTSAVNRNFSDPEDDSRLGVVYTDCAAVDEASPPSLPLKIPSVSIPTKPKAVVVGRVRVEDNEVKVRKMCFQSDVHTSKGLLNSPYETSKPDGYPGSQAIDDISFLTATTRPPSQSYGRNEMGILSMHSSNTQMPSYVQHPPQAHHHPDQSDFHEGSLVVGLLRAHSHGSAEGDSSLAVGCQGSDKPCSSQRQDIVIKRENEDDLTAGSTGYISHGMQNSSSIPNEAAYHHSYPSYASQEPSTHLELSNDARFEFSMQEAINLIQPGCKNKRYSSSSPFKSRNFVDSIMNTAISAEYAAFSLLNNSHSSMLNQAEKIKIKELLEASKGLNNPLCEEPNYKDLPDPSLINVINLTEIAIRRLIKMAKKISAFKMICQEDQIALLKGGCTEMMILRSVPAYDPDKDVWKIQQDYEQFKNIKMKILQSAPGNVYDEHKRFILAFQPEWRQDTRIIALLAAIALFTPERPNVIHMEAVRHEQSSYLYLLKRYLESSYGGCVGKTNYLKLLEIISNLHILNEDLVRVFLEVNPQEVEPLLIEIFDLKQS